jgi:hypothetical protein
MILLTNRQANHLVIMLAIRQSNLKYLDQNLTCIIRLCILEIPDDYTKKVIYCSSSNIMALLAYFTTLICVQR